MARARGIYRRSDSAYWWIDLILPNGVRIRRSAQTANKDEALALAARLRAEAFKEKHLGVKRRRTWQEAVVRYLALKSQLRSIEDARRICRKLDAELGKLTLDRINGDVICRVIETKLAEGRKPATVNRYLALIRCLLRTARDEWQWIDKMPKIRMLHGEVERDRWLTQDEAKRLVAACPAHLAAIVRFALATGCRAREIVGLEWNRVDLTRRTAWLDQTKNGTPRGVPLNRDAVDVLESQVAKHPQYCFTYYGRPIRYELTNSAWKTACETAKLTNLRFHDLRHTWASWHRQAGTSCDELKDLGGWKSRVMVDRYAKFGTEHLAAAAARIEARPLDSGPSGNATEAKPAASQEEKAVLKVEGNVIFMSRFPHGAKTKGAST